MAYKIGIADLTSGSASRSWADKTGDADGIVLVTNKIDEALSASVIQHQDKLILHIVCLGDAALEPRILHEQASALISAGFPRNRIVIRADLTLPAKEGFDAAYSVLESFVSGGFSRYRVNILNTHAAQVGMDALPAQLAAVDNMLAKIRKSWVYLGKPAGDLRIESDPSSGLKETTKCGCPSRYDLTLLGLTASDSPTPLSWRGSCAAGAKAAASSLRNKLSAAREFLWLQCGRAVQKAKAGAKWCVKLVILCGVGIWAVVLWVCGRIKKCVLVVGQSAKRGLAAIARKWKWLLGILLSLCLLYSVAVYSNISFIKECRTLYIETAMSTMNHQWLATSFIPRGVIDEVMAEARRQMEESVVSVSPLPEEPEEPEVGLSPEEIAKNDFAEKFPEIDMSTMPADTVYLDSIQMADVVDAGIKTTAGDSIWAIDTINNLLIVQVTGDGYTGKLAIVKDSSKVKLMPNTRRDRGMTVTEICEEYGAVLGINGNAFEDPNGRGSGVTPVGLIISDGEQLHGPFGASNYQVAGFDTKDRFRVGRDLDTSELRDAMQFYPITVLDGEKHVEGSLGMGIQPRASIGQAEDGSTLLLVIDGRQVGHSLGITVSGCADILLRYNCRNAINLDGGSSASMSYMGEMITKTSSPQAGGRWLPSAWVVMP